MICPYRKRVIHRPDHVDGCTRYYALDTEEFLDCYKKDCPFYAAENDECLKAAAEIGRANRGDNE